MILTFTANRPDVEQLFAGSKDPNLNATVVARLAIPLESAAQVANIIINILTSVGAANTAA